MSARIPSPLKTAALLAAILIAYGIVGSDDYAEALASSDDKSHYAPAYNAGNVSLPAPAAAISEPAEAIAAARRRADYWVQVGREIDAIPAGAVGKSHEVLAPEDEGVVLREFAPAPIPTFPADEFVDPYDMQEVERLALVDPTQYVFVADPLVLGGAWRPGRPVAPSDAVAVSEPSSLWILLPGIAALLMLGRGRR
jgi:hypothetical protein